MTDEPIDTGDDLSDLLLFAVVTAASVGVSMTSFSLWEMLGRKERDKGREL